MTGFASLGRKARDNSAVLSIGRTGAYRWGEFCGSVAATALKIGDAENALVATGNAWCFLVAVFAAMHAGARVVIPHNLQPDTLASLEMTCDLKIDDAFLVHDHEGDFSLEGRDLKLEFFTSGSTGSAKRIVRDLWQMEVEVQTIQSLWAGRIPADAISFATVPHQHVYGLVFHLLWPLLTQRSFYADRFDFWEELLPVLTPGAVLVSSPSHLSRMGGLSPLSKDRAPAAVLTGGAPLSDAAAHEAATILGCGVDEFYGSTETGAIAARRRTTPDPKWRPFPGYRLQRNDAGLLRIDKPAQIAGSGFEIQDRVEFDEVGHFRLLGRADRTVKVEGKRIDLGDVESCLAISDEVAECVVVPIGEDKIVLAAAVVLQVRGKVLLKELGHFKYCHHIRQFLSARIDPIGVPKKWAFLDELPMNALGKRAAEIRKIFESNQDD
jgi:acyl-coenzyme A synthetase/AMP-(fatty) acid ligase